MAFVLLTNPKLDGARYVAPVAAVEHYESIGWKPVAGRDSHKNLKDVRESVAAFEDDASQPATVSTAAAEGTSK